VFPPLYAILDPSLIARPLRQIAQELAAGGVVLMQFRDKVGSARQIYSEARELLEQLTSASVRIIINDRADIAAIVGAGGVHVGQDDLAPEVARSICGTDRWVGVSTHNLAQLREADRTSADYIGVGPIFPTGTKQNPDPVVGVEFVRAARRLTRKPLVAIGGITVQSAADVFRAGADSVAVIRDLLAAPDPGQRVREYLAVAKQARVGSG
jgi:thiamine-phosphate pyrophosphorylase